MMRAIWRSMAAAMAMIDIAFAGPSIKPFIRRPALYSTSLEISECLVKSALIRAARRLDWFQRAPQDTNIGSNETPLRFALCESRLPPRVDGWGQGGKKFKIRRSQIQRTDQKPSDLRALLPHARRIRETE